MNKILYWSPFNSKVATVKSVINSAESINKFYNNNRFKASIINAVSEWDEYKELLKKKKIETIDLSSNSIFTKLNKDGFVRSRLAYWYIFIKCFFPLKNLLKKQQPKFLIIHLITSLPLVLFCIKKFDTKLILRISGLPKMNFVRKTLWKIASKHIHRITCPTKDTYNDLSKLSFLKNKLVVLSDPILNIRDIQNKRYNKVKISDEIDKIITTKKFFLSNGRFTKQKNFLFYLNCIPEILKLDPEIFFVLIGEGQQKKQIIEVSKKLNISNNIFIIDRTDNVHHFMQKSQALILTSLWEDPGFVIVEAGYNNCQVISSNCPNGPKEIIGKDGGYLFDSNSKQSLISAVKTFLEDTKEKKFLKKIILKKRIKRFTSFQHRTKLLERVL